MSIVKMKVTGCFRTPANGEAFARISSYLQSMAALGYNPLVGYSNDTMNQIPNHDTAQEMSSCDFE